jgi:hypothetical protein
MSMPHSVRSPQSLPYYISRAFPEIPRERFLSPIISFKFGKKKARQEIDENGPGAQHFRREISEALTQPIAASMNFSRLMPRWESKHLKKHGVQTRW